MKKLKNILLLTLIMSFVTNVVDAHDIEVKNSDGVTIYYNYNSNRTTLSVTYRGTSPNSYKDEYSGFVKIPKQVTYGGISYAITDVGERAFSGCSNLTSIEIPNSVTKIGNYAFYDCNGLASIEIPNSVTSIGEYTFQNCSSLTSIEIHNNVTSIGGYAFRNCSQLTSVIINSNAIMSKTYTWTSNLESIFGSQVKSYTIGNEVTKIGDFAFHNSNGLTSIEIPNSVTSIGEYTFVKCI